MKEKLELCEANAGILEDEIRSLKIQKLGQGASLAQVTPAANERPTDSINEPGGEISQGQSRRDINSTPPPTSLSTQPSIEKRKYATVAASKSAQSPEQPWTQVKYGNCKQTANRPRLLFHVEQRGKTVLFPQETLGQQKSER